MLAPGAMMASRNRGDSWARTRGLALDPKTQIANDPEIKKK